MESPANPPANLKSRRSRNDEEAAKNCHIGSGHIRYSPSLDRIGLQLPHIPRNVLAGELVRLRPQIQEAVAKTNAELRRIVYLDRIENRRRS